MTEVGKTQIHMLMPAPMHVFGYATICNSAYSIMPYHSKKSKTMIVQHSRIFELIKILGCQELKKISVF